MLETYVKLDGSVVNLMELSDVHRTYLEQCVEQFRAGAAHTAFHLMVFGAENPVLERRPEIPPHLGYVTREAYYTPLFQTLRDLLFRVEIKLGIVAGDPGRHHLEGDPFADEWVPTSQAASDLGISVPAVHKALEAGRLISKPAREGGRNLLISRNSMNAFDRNARRQETGRQGGRPPADG